METYTPSSIAVAEMLLGEWEINALTTAHSACIAHRPLALAQLVSLYQSLTTSSDAGISMNADGTHTVPYHAHSFTVYFATAQGISRVAQVIEQLANQVSKDNSCDPKRQLMDCSLSIGHGTYELTMDELGELCEAIFQVLVTNRNEMSFGEHLANVLATTELQLCVLLHFY
ncbi:hypothetical protein [Hymenobacter baengnokdamensis]|uniref:hypothetical protein n=1 Tax=Hymenobacter baengnokdamensis TaxID=2615203 RepID=UPI001245A32A|nr:hypothetical protein [Hymenobacter baengnokdamensis]